jgi:hypothetical protein
MLFRRLFQNPYFENTGIRIKSIALSTNQNFLDANPIGCFLYMKRPSFQLYSLQKLLLVSELKDNWNTNHGIKLRIPDGIQSNYKMRNKT